MQTTLNDLLARVAILGDATPLTPEQAAQLLGKSVATLNRLVAGGRLKRTKVRRSSYFLLGDIKALLAGETAEVQA